MHLMRITILLFPLLSFSYSHGQASLTSTDLPLLVINTNGQTIPDDPKITATLGIVDNGPGNRNRPTDSFNVYNGKIGIEVRGQSSQMFPMKSYSIELRNDAGKSVDQSLFGLPAESDWVMYAPYTDKTLMRNFLAYSFSAGMGHWASHCRFTEVILNGQYVGIYVFMEKIKRGSGRVDIAKLKATDSTGDNLTGGYIFSIDKEANGWFSKFSPPNAPSARIQYSYVVPKPEDITPLQKDYIKSTVDDFENALAGPQFRDSLQGYRKFIDPSSFIDFLIVNEISRNVDGYRLSSFFYKDKNSHDPRIHAGPVWDYDLAFRNADYCDGSLAYGWAYDFNSVCSSDYWQIPFWWKRLLGDSSFQADLYCRWAGLRKDLLSESSINHWIDSITTLTAEARSRHFAQWHVLGQYVWPNPQPIPSSYSEEITALKTWIRNRLFWIDDNIDKTGPCAPPPPPVSFEDFDIHIWPNPVLATMQVRLSVPVAQSASIQVVNSAGQTILTGNYSLKKGLNELPFTTASWSSGVYYIRVNFGNGVKKTYPVVKS